MRWENRWELNMPGPVANEFSPLGRVLSREMTRSEQSGTLGRGQAVCGARAGGEAGGGQEVTATSR